MARASRNKPTSTGPGSGSPRSRTAARPGERAAGTRTRTRAVDPPPEAPEPTPAARRATSRALGMTWRLLILGVALATIAVTLGQSLRVYFAQAEQIAELRVEIQARHDEIAGLEDQLERWNDPRFVEAEARERLGWVMPGEVGYRVIGADGEPIGGESDVFGTEDEAPGLWWEKMWGSVQVADQPVPAEAEPDQQPDPDVIISATPSPSHTG